MRLPPDFTLLQVVPELETGGAEQSTIDVAQAVVRADPKQANKGAGAAEAAMALLKLQEKFR